MQGVRAVDGAHCQLELIAPCVVHSSIINTNNGNGVLIGTCTDTSGVCTPLVDVPTVSDSTTAINIFCVDPFTGIPVPGCVWDGDNFVTSGVNIQGNFLNVQTISVSGITFQAREKPTHSTNHL